MRFGLHNIQYKADHRLANWKPAVSGAVAGSAHGSTSLSLFISRFLSAVWLLAQRGLIAVDRICRQSQRQQRELVFGSGAFSSFHQFLQVINAVGVRHGL